jgi:predicted Zn finger-like uncharacterized protein
MNEQVFTRCPGCATVFRVSPAQLALREGQVRCGHCRAVFDANDHRLSLDGSTHDDTEPPDELAAGRPTVTLRSADALLPVQATAVPRMDRDETLHRPGANAPPPAMDAAESAAPPLTDTDKSAAPPATDTDKSAPPPATDKDKSATTPPVGNQAPSAASPTTDIAGSTTPADTDAVGLRADRLEWKPRKPLHERPRTLYGLALAALVIAVGLQAVLEYRDALVAHVPLTRPVLEGACALFGCTVGPLRDAAALSIDASDLQADPAHRGLLKLSATIRNRASYPIARPYLELTLTDASDRVVARRAFGPGEYAAARADSTRGIPGNGEDVVTLFLDASETSQAGYRLYLFYP